MSRTVLVVTALLFSACARHLVPAPDAKVVDPRGKAAVGSDAGVTIVARTDAWRGFPQGVDSVVTPLLVTIDNVSGRPLRLTYEQMALRGPGETRYAALTPYDIDGYVSEPVAVMPYGAFHYDPFWRHSYGWPYGWGDPFQPWRTYRTVRLPTSDMVKQALPETVLESGARTSGFVFLQRATRKKGTPLELTIDLVDGRSSERFGQVRIPFVVD